mmetsp:Transcript_89657/g.254173  ORF Transcript_89657/g.254173 Transcript_89657/m.254173 type:complete len:133 (+) Transcript_89657:83-481(+)|eukprot:CAMPEP_0179303172 /NCGR_PEP_ID=MMETSP0797-20121207/48443_1 /TAXON_ID=47934 /ORGANISM="Dinophysis acuminata, Strain DAEP01" /LENGTH=132 /DNA_ID=CAMNT_0021012725 /DNA_START=77 /DNA_END=475 /DNA_ORIENTATION=-
MSRAGSSTDFAVPTAPWKSFEVHIHRSYGALLGIETVRAGAFTPFRGLFIKSVIDGGLVARWNHRNLCRVQVRPGDTIIQVNDKEGDESAIAEELRTRDELYITVQPCQAIIESCEATRHFRRPNCSPAAST